MFISTQFSTINSHDRHKKAAFFMNHLINTRHTLPQHIVCHHGLSWCFVTMVYYYGLFIVWWFMVCRIMVSWYHGRISLGESEEPTFCAWQDFLFQRAMLNEKVNPCDHNHYIYFQKWLSFIAISVMSYGCKEHDQIITKGEIGHREGIGCSGCFWTRKGFIIIRWTPPLYY